MIKTTNTPIQLTWGTQIFIDKLTSQNAPPILHIGAESSEAVFNRRSIKIGT